MAATNEILAADVVRSIARSEQMKAFVERSPEIYQALLAAARRFVTGEKREDALKAASDLSSKGYGISLEFIDENTADGGTMC